MLIKSILIFFTWNVLQQLLHPKAVSHKDLVIENNGELKQNKQTNTSCFPHLVQDKDCLVISSSLQIQPVSVIFWKGVPVEGWLSLSSQWLNCPIPADNFGC